MKTTPRVEIFKKARCPLCDEALAIVEKVQSRLPFEIKVTDIGHSPFLYERFRWDVPVVVVDGVQFSVHHVNEALFEARVRECLFHQ